MNALPEDEGGGCFLPESFRGLLVDKYRSIFTAGQKHNHFICIELIHESRYLIVDFGDRQRGTHLFSCKYLNVADG